MPHSYKLCEMKPKRYWQQLWHDQKKNLKFTLLVEHLPGSHLAVALNFDPTKARSKGGSGFVQVNGITYWEGLEMLRWPARGMRYWWQAVDAPQEEQTQKQDKVLATVWSNTLAWGREIHCWMTLCIQSQLETILKFRNSWKMWKSMKSLRCHWSSRGLTT